MPCPMTNGYPEQLHNYPFLNTFNLEDTPMAGGRKARKAKINKHKRKKKRRGNRHKNKK